MKNFVSALFLTICFVAAVNCNHQDNDMIESQIKDNENAFKHIFEKREKRALEKTTKTVDKKQSKSQEKQDIQKKRLEGEKRRQDKQKQRQIRKQRKLVKIRESTKRRISNLMERYFQKLNKLTATDVQTNSTITAFENLMKKL